MNLIIPMAGIGKRMRPHTLTVPKPLVPVAGKPIVHWLIEDIAKVCGEEIEEIGFIIGEIDEEAKLNLHKIAEQVGAKAKLFRQEEALGTAHAIMCAEECLKGDVIVAFADTLFKAEFDLDKSADGVVWVHNVEDPSAFGVVTLDNAGHITQFVEKPKEFVSNHAIIGIYYFKDGETLRSELNYLLENKIMEKGEYQLTNALENMRAKGKKFAVGEVIEWWDCGNKDATVYTNQRVLQTKADRFKTEANKYPSSTIIDPCYIGDNVTINNSKIGPNVSIGSNTHIENSSIENSIIQTKSVIKNITFRNSMVGNEVTLDGTSQELSIGDYCTQA
jgi:glucose-1-phosphate thymidylyltransferase